MLQKYVLLLKLLFAGQWKCWEDHPRWSSPGTTIQRHRPISRVERFYIPEWHQCSEDGFF